ncbi:hypothetical protein GCM10010360_16940 [Streptomyces nogalater]
MNPAQPAPTVRGAGPCKTPRLTPVGRVTPHGGNTMRDWWLTMADGNPQDDSDSGNKHGGGGSDEGGNTNDGRGPADGR